MRPVFSVFTCILSVTSIITASVIEKLYKRRGGYRLEGVTHPMPSSSSMGRVRCAHLCSINSLCRSFNFRPSVKNCVFNNKKIYDFGTYTALDPDWEYYGEEMDDVADGDWILAFRGENANGVKISTVWDGSSFDDPKLVDPACFSIRRDVTCSNHYKSKRMGTWNSEDIKKVRFNLYKQGEKVVEMVFNGQDTTKDDWYDKSRLLLSSNWIDILTATIATFSISGQANRRFYITTESDKFSCITNYGWIAIINAATNYCLMDKSYAVPAFLYSGDTTAIHFDSQSQEADVMVVFFTSKDI